MVAVACGTAGWPGDLFRVRSPPRLGSRASRQARPQCLRCCPGSTVTALGRPPYRAREGHGQHLQLRSLVSDPDDRNADHLGLDAARRAVEPPVTIGRERPNGFKSIRSSRVTAAAALAFRHSGVARQLRFISRISRARAGDASGSPRSRLALRSAGARTIRARACSMVRTLSQVRLTVTRSRNRWHMRGHPWYPLPRVGAGLC